MYRTPLPQELEGDCFRYGGLTTLTAAIISLRCHWPTQPLELFRSGAKDSVSECRSDGQASGLGSQDSMLREALGFLNVAKDCSSGTKDHLSDDEMGVVSHGISHRSAMANRHILTGG